MAGVKSIDGLPIFDAKKPIQLHITKEDISGADKKKPNSCAVAKACSRQLHAKEVRVHLGRVYVRTNNTNWQRFITPKPMRTEIIAFDRGGKFMPDTYHLAAPHPTAKASGKRQGGKDKPKIAKRVSGGKKKTRQVKHIVQDVRTGAADIR